MTTTTLVICGAHPIREDSGAAQRTMHFVRYFKRLGRVDLAYMRGAALSTPGGSPFGRELRLEQRPPLGPAHLGQLGRLLRLHRVPLPIAELTRASEEQLLSAVAHAHYDHVLVRDLYNAAPVLRFSAGDRQRTIVDVADLLSGLLYDDRFGASRGRHKRAILTVNRRYLRRYERRCVKQVGAALFCSRAELEAIAENGSHGNSFVVPNVYAPAATDGDPPGGTTDTGHVLLFVGALNYGPNVRGLTWFLHSVFPEFRRRYPDARLVVVGKAPTAEAREICRAAPAVALRADEVDLWPHYARCRAVVVPILAAGGTRIKILEAAWAKRPILSTPVGAAGLELVDQRELLLFRDAADFCDQYAALDDPTTYRSVTEHAAAFVRRHHSTEVFVQAMDAVLSHRNLSREGRTGVLPSPGS